MFGWDDSTLFTRPKPAQPVMPAPMGAVGIGDPTVIQPQPTNATPPPALTLPSPSPASAQAPVPTKKPGAQFVGGQQGLL